MCLALVTLDVSNRVFESYPKVKNGKALTAIQTLIGLANRIVRFEIAANRWRFELRSAANCEPGFKTEPPARSLQRLPGEFLGKFPVSGTQHPKHSKSPLPFRDFLKALATTGAMKRGKISCTFCSDCAVSSFSLQGRCTSRSLKDSAKVIT